MIFFKLPLIFYFILFFNNVYSFPNIDVTEPRQFGYVLGDVFKREIIIKSTPEYSFQINKKKLIGRVNNWLSIRKINTREFKKEGFLIEIEYQVVNVPSKPLMVVVPQFEVKYVKDLIKSEIKTPELLVTLAPITPEIILNRGGLLDIQPNSTVKKIKTEGILLKIYIIFILFLIPLVVLLYCWAPWHKFLVRNKMPFSYASLKIKKLKNSSNLVFWKQALTYYHFALNSTANKIVFLDNVDDFFSKNTQYQKFSNEIKFFLLCSRNLFFEGKGCPDEKDKNLFIKTIEQLSLIEKNIG